MAVAVSGGRESAAVPSPVPAVECAALGGAEVLARLGSGPQGVVEGEAARRLRVVGPNAVRSYRARPWPVLWSQLRSPLLLYDSSQLAIPTDEVDSELIAQPTLVGPGLHPQVHAVFGPISSVFDFATFGIMLWVFHAGPALFRSGWFVESLATQTLVIFVIRTRRIPFFHSRPSVPLLLAALAVVIVGAVLPFTPLGHLLGFRPLPGLFFLALAGIVVCYLVLIEVGKYWFYRLYHASATPAPRHRTAGFRVHRRAARFTTHSRKPARPGSTAPAG